MIPTLSVPAATPRWRSWLELTKPRVVALMLLTVVVGMLLATTSVPPAQLMASGVAGIGLVAAAAAALNHLIDRRVDAQMARTRHRPLPSGSLRAPAVAAFAALLGTLGTALLLAFTNALCAALTVASLVGYAGVYSLWLKRATPQNIVIGGAAGAMPPLLGWVAVTGHVDPGALALFLIVFVWTPAHFWPLAIQRRDEYARAAIPMLPVTHGVAFTCRRIVGYAVLLVPVSLLPVATGTSHAPYLAGALLLGARFVRAAWRLRRDVRLAPATFRASIGYLFGLFVLLLVDHWIVVAR